MKICTGVRLFLIHVIVVNVFPACTKKQPQASLPDHSHEVIADKQLRGFLDLTWGMSMAECRKRMEARPGVTFKDSLPTGGLIFEGGEFAGQQVLAWLLQSGAGFHRVRLVFQPDESKLVDEFNAFKTFVAKKYGKPDEDFAFVEEPYREGDGKQVEAIQNGKGDYAAFWKFAEGNMIQCKITPKLTIMVTYDNEKLGENARKQRTDKAFEDL